MPNSAPIANASLLQKTIQQLIETQQAKNRERALIAIKAQTDAKGLYAFAKDYGVLVDNSAEDFAIEFMTAYNQEICAETY